MLEALRKRMARALWPKQQAGHRMYASARPSRLAGAAAPNSSADTELATSLRELRGRSRQLVRDASYAKRAKTLIMNNVIGPGIGMQSQVKTTRNELNKTVNDAIEAEYAEWCKATYCHTGGELHFHDLERALMGEVFEAGEVFVRLHPVAFGGSRVPLALEMIEAERVPEEIQPGPAAAGNTVRMGIEVDDFYRPQRVWIRERHPGEFRLGVHQTDRYLPVSSDFIIHLKIIDRWPQTRGVPWLHTTIRRLQDMDGYSEAEIVAARAAANYFFSVETPEDPGSPVGGEKQDDGSLEMAMEPGMGRKLAPGEKLNFHAPNRPNTALDPFMRYMLREVAAGTGPSYESLSRDYSQSNYSSSRLALLDDRDLWRVLQQWFIRSFRMRVHDLWLQQAVFARAIPQIPLEAYASDGKRYCAVRYKPRGWSWIDPSKEVDAAVKSVRAGFTDVGDVIAKSADGRDLEDVLEARKQELEMMRALGLKFDTDPDNKADGSPAKEPKQEPKPAPAPEAAKPKDEDPKEGEPERAVRAFGAVLVDIERARKPAQNIVNLPAINVEQPAVNVKAGDVHVAPGAVTVNAGDVSVEPTPVRVENIVPVPNVEVAAPSVNVAAPDVRVDNHVAAPVVNVEAPEVHVAAPSVTVEPPEVRIDNRVEVQPPEETEQKIERDDRGEITRISTRRVR